MSCLLWYKLDVIHLDNNSRKCHIREVPCFSTILAFVRISLVLFDIPDNRHVVEYLQRKCTQHCRIAHGEHILCLYSLSGKTSYPQISWSLEAVRLDVMMITSLLILTGIMAALLQRCQLNFRAIEKVSTRISWLWDFTRSCGKMPVRLVNRGHGMFNLSDVSFNVNLVELQQSYPNKILAHIYWVILVNDTTARIIIGV